MPDHWSSYSNHYHKTVRQVGIYQHNTYQFPSPKSRSRRCFESRSLVSALSFTPDRGPVALTTSLTLD